MHKHVHATYTCVVPETGDIHVVEKLQPAEYLTDPANNSQHLVFTGPPYYYCPGFNLVSHLKDARGLVIGFRMYRKSDVIADPVEVSVVNFWMDLGKPIDLTKSQPESGQSSVTIDHSGKHVPRKEEI